MTYNHFIISHSFACQDFSKDSSWFRAQKLLLFRWWQGLKWEGLGGIDGYRLGISLSSCYLSCFPWILSFLLFWTSSEHNHFLWVRWLNIKGQHTTAQIELPDKIGQSVKFEFQIYMNNFLCTHMLWTIFGTKLHFKEKGICCLTEIQI